MRSWYEELRTCYSLQAQHFWHTRKKFWPELEYIQRELEEKPRSTAGQGSKRKANHAVLRGESWTSQAIISRQENRRDAYYAPSKSNNSDTFIILELGCGIGREKLFEMIEYALRGHKWIYTGVDNASWMIEQAQKQAYGKSENIRFICADMIDYLRSLEDESIDCILWIASIQHLMDEEQRQILRQHAYRVLKRDGKMMLVNRSYSLWFLKKYRKFQLKTLVKTLWTWGERNRNDIIIPWKDPWFQQNQKYRQRRYHIFTLYELQQLSLLSGFIVEKLGYIQQDGSWDKKNRKNSRNSLLVVRKGVNKVRGMETGEKVISKRWKN